MRKRLNPLLFVAVLLLMKPVFVSAEYLHCKNESVNVGDTRSALLQRCGEPVRLYAV